MRRLCLAMIAAAALGVLTGCGVQIGAPAAPVSSAAMGKAYGGRQPITGGVVQLWAVGTTTDGAAATALITSLTATTSDGTGVGGNASNGNNTFQAGYFTISHLYTCPTSSTLVYITIAGGNPGLTQGTNNTASVVMAALGQCGTLSSSTFITVDEVTTVAAVSALSTYMSSYSAIGSGSNGAAGLAAAFTLATGLANTTTGLSPGVNIPAGYTVPTQAINTLADAISACINSTGGTAGDNSICGNLFSATNYGSAPTDVSAALLNIANFPYSNILQIFNLDSGFAPFQPTLSTPPTNWATALGATSPTLSLSPTLVQFAGTTLFFSTSQQVVLTNATNSSVSLTGFVLGGADQSEFSASNNCGASLAANSNCLVTVVFTPAATGTQTAGLEVDNSAGPPLYLPLSGTGVAAAGTETVTLTPTGPVIFTDVGHPAELTAGQLRARRR